MYIMNISCFSDIFEWLMGFANFERHTSSAHKEFRLNTMYELAALTGHPEQCAPVIHVAGSKGKGSVTGMIARILEYSGLKTAQYYSPHVSDCRERIMTGSVFFPEDVYISAGTELVAAEKAYTGADPLSFFELMTIYFFLCARTAQCDCMVIETGMGGRLDATNIVDPLVSVITVIELEHTAYLGSTLAAIAREKAGIIKPTKPVVLAEQKPEALAVFRETANEQRASLYYFPDYACIKDIQLFPAGTSFTLEVRDRDPLDLIIPIPGKIQAYNAGLAVLAAGIAFPDTHTEVIKNGLGHFTLPARFERISKGKKEPVMVIDGAHTQNSIQECVDTFTTLYGAGNTLLFGCVADKDPAPLAHILAPHFSHIIITRPGTFKASFLAPIYEAFTEEKKKKKEKKDGSVLFIEETDQAAFYAQNLGLPVLVTGSFYLAAEVRRFVLRKKE
jgi:dihydrofolate synthase/folylpolyglutamate synthase